MEFWFRSNRLSSTLHVVELMLLICYIDGTVKFTEVPPKVLYVAKNETAKFEWNYMVTNRDSELKAQSPTWDLYFPNGSFIQLAYENINNRSWRLSNSCPSRLRERLKIESPGSLVISQVMPSDDGIYGCSLRLITGERVTNTSQLIVIDPPTFVNPPPNKTMISEGDDLHVMCTASGKPVPTVTWTKLGISDIISSGRGSATLAINNIRRYSNGTYKCQANNKLQEPITLQTTVVIYYRPRVDVPPSFPLNVPSWNGHVVNLQCLVTGNPLPTILWMGPNKQSILYGVSSLKGGSLLTVTTNGEEEYGEYKCHATNSRGFDQLGYKIYKIAVPDPPVIKKFSSEASAISITWRRPLNDGGSSIIDYRISISTTPVREVSVKDTSIVIPALEEDTSYLVNISAGNIVGYGNATTLIASTKKGSITPSPKSSTALAVCLPIIFILVLVIIGLLIYLWWKIKKSKEGVVLRDTDQKAETNAQKQDESNTVEEKSKQNGQATEGSCFQPFLKKTRRRPRQPRPLPLHILEPIKEEKIQEEEEEIEENEEMQKSEEKGEMCVPVNYKEIKIEPEISDVQPNVTAEVSLA